MQLRPVSPRENGGSDCAPAPAVIVRAPGCRRYKLLATFGNGFQGATAGPNLLEGKASIAATRREGSITSVEDEQSMTFDDVPRPTTAASALSVTCMSLHVDTEESGVCCASLGPPC